MTKRYPAFLNLKDANVLIVGGGLACLEKLTGLENTEANISIITIELNPEVKKFVENKTNITTIIREVKDVDLENRDLIFLATNNSEINAKFRKVANQLKILTNSVDDPNNCDFYSASLIDLGAVSFAISTDGKFAGLSAALRKLFEEIMPSEDTELFQKIYEMRAALKKRIPDMNERKKVLKDIIFNLESKYFNKE